MRIGFNIYDEKITQNTVYQKSPETLKPVRSVVKVYFEEIDREYPYYNDEFVLGIGDIVYVDGKLSGKIGRVTSVNTHFKVSLDYYKRVVAKLDLTIHGEYFKDGPFMCCYDKQNKIAEQFKSWITPPTDEEKEYFIGEGYRVDIKNLSNNEFLTETIVYEAVSCIEQIEFFTLTGGEGHAFYKGHDWHQIDFNYKQGIVENLFCNCNSPDFCKHLAAVCLILNIFVNSDKKDSKKELLKSDELTLINRNTFFRLVEYCTEKIII